MDDNDINAQGGRFRAADLSMAFGLLTRLPLPYPDFDVAPARPAAHAAWAYPLVGIAVALLAALVAWVLDICGLPAQITAGFVLLAMVICTGAMHEDGLADCADGFWGGWDVARRLAIMKDSQIGSYGVIALVLSLLLRWGGIALMINADALLGALVCAAVTSRAAMVTVMYHLPRARSGGLSAQTGKPSGAATLLAVGIALLVALLTPQVSVFWLIVVSTALTLGGITIARHKIGGQTGDVLGATQQITEIGVWLVCAANLTA